VSTRFFVRVQLHGIADDHEAYDTLHKEMKSRGFKRTVNSNDEKYWLPTGCYRGSADDTGGTKSAAADRVQKAVDRTGRKASFVVVETEESLEKRHLKRV
jgi:hypothetical protein